MPKLERLPKGKRRDPNSCPCGKATGLSVGLTAYDFDTKKDFGIPPAVARFIVAFDEGKLPQYDEDQL